jgi:hypothetical protein
MKGIRSGDIRYLFPGVIVRAVVHDNDLVAAALDIQLVV